MRVQVLDEATGDLANGYRFYESQVEGLGEYFLDSLWSDIISLRLYAGIHAVHHDYHRLLSKRFPFAVYYRIVLAESQKKVRGPSPHNAAIFRRRRINLWMNLP